MKKIILSLLVLFAPSLLLAAGGGYKLSHANVSVSDTAAIQRGAKVFTDYCLSCHTARFVRFNRLAADTGLSEQQVMSNLNNVGAKFGDTMTIAMSPDYAKKSFGAEPPDLSLVARSRGTDWLYTYLTGFYVDSKRTSGYNNVVFKDVGMPNVFWKLQGDQEAVYEIHTASDGSEEKVLKGIKLAKQGTMDPAEFKEMVRDLVTFLEYIGEPKKDERKRLGIWVLAFLFILFVFSYFLKKEYWKDVH